MVNHANKVKQQHGHIGEGHQNLHNKLIIPSKKGVSKPSGLNRRSFCYNCLNFLYNDWYSNKNQNLCT